MFGMPGLSEYLVGLAVDRLESQVGEFHRQVKSFQSQNGQLLPAEANAAISKLLADLADARSALAAI